MDKSPKDYAKLKKPNTKDYTMYYYMYMKI